MFFAWQPAVAVYQCHEVTRTITPRRVHDRSGACSTSTASERGLTGWSRDACDLARSDFAQVCPAMLPATPLLQPTSHNGDHPFGQRPRYSTCALVGSGGSLLGSRCGERIDAHEFVLRVNAPLLTPQYAPDVGSKRRPGFTRRLGATELALGLMRSTHHHASTHHGSASCAPLTAAPRRVRCRTSLMAINGMLSRGMVAHPPWTTTPDPTDENRDPNPRALDFSGMDIVSLAALRSVYAELGQRREAIQQAVGAERIFAASMPFFNAVVRAGRGASPPRARRAGGRERGRGGAG